MVPTESASQGKRGNVKRERETERKRRKVGAETYRWTVPPSQHGVQAAKGSRSCYEGGKESRAQWEPKWVWIGYMCSVCVCAAMLLFALHSQCC